MIPTNGAEEAAQGIYVSQAGYGQGRRISPEVAEMVFEAAIIELCWLRGKTFVRTPPRRLGYRVMLLYRRLMRDLQKVRDRPELTEAIRTLLLRLTRGPK